MPLKPVAQPVVSEKTYQRLVATLRREIERMMARVKKYAVYATIRSNWMMGRHIHRVLLKGADRAPDFFYQRLHEDLNISVRHLQDIVKFFRLYPKMPGDTGLSWTHYHILTTIADPARRRRIEGRVIKEKIGIDDLRLLVRAPDNAPLVRTTRGTIAYTRGVLYAYAVMKVNTLHDKNFLTLDCGFDISFYKALSDDLVYKSGKICRSVKDGESYRAQGAMNLRGEDLYTYQAMVERLIDGDTLLANVDVGFGINTRQKLRLRGIDCPELGTQNGLAARKYVEAIFAQCPIVVIKTYKSDKYDRYLVDVFYLPGEADPAVIAAKGRYLNQELIDQALAQLWE